MRGDLKLRFDQAWIDLCTEWVFFVEDVKSHPGSTWGRMIWYCFWFLLLIMSSYEFSMTHDEDLGMHLDMAVLMLLSDIVLFYAMNLKRIKKLEEEIVELKKKVDS